MTSVEPEEVAVSVFRAHDLRAAKPGRGRFWTVFGTHKTKLQTGTVQENHGAPVWNTQGAIALLQNDRVLKFKVLDGDHVCGQIQLPISQIPRRQEEAHPVTAPLQSHKRCANPSGNLVYSCYVSKFRTASASGSNNQLTSGTENQRSNQESGSSNGRRGSLGVMNSLSSSLTNLVKLRSGSKSGSGRSDEQEAEQSSRAPVPKAESRRRGDSNLAAAAKSDERRGSQPNLAPSFASTSAVSAQNGTRGQASESGGASWRVYEVEDAEAASSVTAESISMHSNSSLPVGLGASTQRVAPQAPAIANANANVRNAPTSTNVPIGGPPAVFNKPSPLASSGPSYGSSAYSSGSSYSSNVNVSVGSTSANANVAPAVVQPSITLTSVVNSTTLSEARMSVSSFDQSSEILTRNRAGSGQTPQQVAPVLASQYQFQKGYSVHGTGVASGARGSTAAQSRTAEGTSLGSTTDLTPSAVNFAKRPRVTLIDPPEGSVQGGTKLRICGENLGDQQTDIRAVYVCGSNCIGSLFWRTPNEIIVTTKPWRECTGFVVVETPHGRSNSAVQFSFRDYKIQPTASPASAQLQQQPQLQQQQSPSSTNSGLPSAPVRRRLSTAHLGLECETTDTVQVGTNNVSLAVGSGMQNDSQVPAFANPLELTSEICRLRSRVQELEMQNVQLRTDGERLQQYIDSLTQKILSRCPEILCADGGIDKSKEKQQPKPRTRSSSLFSLFGVGQKEDEKTARKDTVEQLRQFASQQNTAANAPANVPTTAPRRSFAPPSANGASGGSGYEPTNPSMIMTNEIMQL